MTAQYRFGAISVAHRVTFTLVLFLSTLMLLCMNLEKSNKQHRPTHVIDLSALYIDNILDSKHEIIKDKSIFFVDTTRMKKPWKTRELTLRQACSIESAALTNRHSEIFVILVTPYSQLTEIEFTPVMQSLLEYPNINIQSLNLAEFATITSYDAFTRNGSLLKSVFIKQHTSDFLRLLLLKTYGGTYLDMDMVVMKDLRQLSTNCICRDHGFLNGAFLKLDTKNGKTISKMFLDDMIENFNGTEWGWNGPLMFSRVLDNQCKNDNCGKFEVIDENICYPVEGLDWPKLFDEDIADEIVASIRNSYMLHIWNKLSQKKKLDCDSQAAYAQIAQRYCPKVFDLCEDYF